jgi:hypothetical protein
MILLAVLQRKDDAYGVTIHEELTRHTTRPVARGAVYMTLDRLEKKGFLKSTLTEPTAERGGRTSPTHLWVWPGARRRRDDNRISGGFRGVPALGVVSVRDRPNRHGYLCWGGARDHGGYRARVLPAGATLAPGAADAGAETRLAIPKTDGFHELILFWRCAVRR